MQDHPVAALDQLPCRLPANPVRRSRYENARHDAYATGNPRPARDWRLTEFCGAGRLLPERREGGGLLDGGWVAEAEDHGNRAERLAEAGARPVGCVRVVDGRPVHLLVRSGKAGHRVGEFHRGHAVPLEEGTPAERGERGGELPDGQRAAGGAVDTVDRGGQFNEVGGTLGEGGRLGAVRGTVSVDLSESLSLHG